MPTKTLPSSPSLEHLKHQARDLLKAHRSGESEAHSLIREFHPEFKGRSDAQIHAAPFALADAQLVIARQYGFASWVRLKEHVETGGAGPAAVAPLNDAVVSRFLEYACPDHHIRGGHAHIMARHAALRLLAKHRGLRRANLCTAVACGDLQEVRRILAERPDAARQPWAAPELGRDRADAGTSDDLFQANGPKNWEPLLFLCFTRLSLTDTAENALEIARALLDCGANPNAFFKAGDSIYTPLVGAIGEGEEERLPHPRRDELADLLLERGANPFDMQVIYNLHFHGRILWFLKLIHKHSGRSRKQSWDDPDWRMLDMGPYGNGSRFLLNLAVQRNDLELAEWVLEHGASPNAAPPKSPQMPRGPLHEEAMSLGYFEMAELLARHGAKVSGAAERNPFLAACLRGDRARATELAAKSPSLLKDIKPMTIAARMDRVDVAELLLDLGASPDFEGVLAHLRPLHIAASHGAAKVAALLVQRGAKVDARDPHYHSTPLGWAVYYQNMEVAEVLCAESRDLWNLAFLGKVERVREVLRVEPDLARAVRPDGHTALMLLPDDEDKALAIAEMLLAHGADAAAWNGQGLSAEDLALKRGLNRVANLLNTSAAARGER